MNVIEYYKNKDLESSVGNEGIEPIEFLEGEELEEWDRMLKEDMALVLEKIRAEKEAERKAKNRSQNPLGVYTNAGCNSPRECEIQMPCAQQDVAESVPQTIMMDYYRNEPIVRDENGMIDPMEFLDAEELTIWDRVLNGDPVALEEFCSAKKPEAKRTTSEDIPKNPLGVHIDGGYRNTCDGQASVQSMQSNAILPLQQQPYYTVQSSMPISPLQQQPHHTMQSSMAISPLQQQPHHTMQSSMPISSLQQQPCDTRQNSIPILPLQQQPYHTMQTSMPIPRSSPATSMQIGLEQPSAIVQPYQSNALPTFRKQRDVPKGYDLKEKLKCSLSIRVKSNALYAYTGTYYQRLEEQDAKRLIVKICKKEVEDNGGISIIDQAYKLLLLDPDLAADYIMDERTLVSFTNGILRITTGEFLPHSPQYFTTYQLDCAYMLVNGLECPCFDQFLNESMQGDMALVTRLWEIIGYCLVPDQLAKVAFVFQGRSNSGKTQLTNLLTSFYPEWKVTSMDVQKLKKDFALSELEDRALCFSNDMENGALDNNCVANIKKYTGNDLMTAEKKYSQARTFRATGKLILVSNHPLLTKTPDTAFENRIVAVPFLHSVPKEEWDLQLLEKLKYERSAIAYKAIQAYFRLRENQYQFSGDYVVNSADCFADSASSATNIETAVYAFVRMEYELGSEADYVCIAEAWEEFQEFHGTVSQSLFSQYFSRFADELHGGRKVRSRMGKYPNARWCIQGLRTKAEF